MRGAFAHVSELEDVRTADRGVALELDRARVRVLHEVVPETLQTPDRPEELLEPAELAVRYALRLSHVFANRQDTCAGGAAVGPELCDLRRARLPRTRVNRLSGKLAFTDLGSNPPSIARRIFDPAATVRIAFPLLRLIDGETTGFESPPV
jgi:hypothetical protein